MTQSRITFHSIVSLLLIGMFTMVTPHRNNFTMTRGMSNSM